MPEADLGEAIAILHADTAPTWRGGQAQVWGLLTGLAARGHRQLLAAPPEGPLAQRARAAGIAVAPWTPRHDLDLPAALALVATARAFGPDVVHLHSARAHATGILAARATAAATLVARRVDFTVGRNAASRWKYRLPVDRYVTVSREIARVLAASGVPEARIAVVHSGIDVAGRAAEVARARVEGRGAALRAQWGIAPGAPLVGIVAALAPHKHHANFVAAAEQLLAKRPDARFVIAGDGPCAERVRDDVVRRGLAGRVVLAGFVDDVPALLAALDVFALSSYLEGLGTSVLDAMAAGVPVVATDVGGIPEMVTHGRHGLLVPARDPAALAGAWHEVLAHPDAAHDRAAAARAKAEDFSLARTVERTEALYRAILGQRRRPA